MACHNRAHDNQAEDVNQLWERAAPTRKPTATLQREMYLVNVAVPRLDDFPLLRETNMSFPAMFSIHNHLATTAPEPQGAKHCTAESEYVRFQLFLHFCNGWPGPLACSRMQGQPSCGGA